jgi:hypothetical protein
MEKKRLKFVQIFKNISPIFVIKNRNNKNRSVKEKKIQDVNLGEYKIDIEFSAPELDAYDLRTLIYLTANVNVRDEELKVLESLDDNELIEALGLKLQPLQRGKFSKVIRFETSWNQILSDLGLAYHPDNMGKIKQSLKYLHMSVVTLRVKDAKTNRTKLELTSSLLMFHADVLPEDRRNNKLVLLFSPFFYLVKFRETVYKSTVNIEVFQKLFEIETNMPIVYYVLCDNVDFGKEKEFSVEDLELLCYGNVAKDRRIKSKRRKFLFRTLQEIERLSNGSFIVKIDQKEDKIKVKRIPDRRKIDGKQENKSNEIKSVSASK